MSQEVQIWTIAEEAASYVEDDMVVGMGTGRAASMFVHALALRVKRGLKLFGVPTSKATESLAETLGIPVVSLSQVDRMDIDVDGADEVDPKLNLIKGHGGALVRERVVASRSRRFVILVGEEKLVPQLGATRKVPVECVPFAVPVVEREIAALGGVPSLRVSDDGPVLTDNHNTVIDAGFGSIEDPAELELRLDRLAGVVDNGLFVDMASLVLVQSAEGVRRMEKR